VTTARLLVVVAIGAVLVWLASTIGAAVDRGLRTETIDGFAAAGPIHLAPDGRILLARSGSSAGTSDGRIEAFDPTTRSRTPMLDGLVDPIAADIAPDGTICAIGRPRLANLPASLRCSSGLAVDFATGAPSGLIDARPHVADVVSDGSDGWVVTDPDRAVLLHVDRAGTVALLASVHQYAAVPGRPLGLTRDGGRILVATGDQGYAQVSSSDRGVETRIGTLVGSGFVAAIATRPNGIPVVLIIEGSAGVAASTSTAAEVGPRRLTDALDDPRGVVILPDGRVAVAAGSRLVIVRPSPPLE
jgi:hypothetical protein